MDIALDMASHISLISDLQLIVLLFCSRNCCLSPILIKGILKEADSLIPLLEFPIKQIDLPNNVPKSSTDRFLII